MKAFLAVFMLAQCFASSNALLFGLLGNSWINTELEDVTHKVFNHLNQNSPRYFYTKVDSYKSHEEAGLKIYDMKVKLKETTCLKAATNFLRKTASAVKSQCYPGKRRWKKLVKKYRKKSVTLNYFKCRIRVIAEKNKKKKKLDIIGFQILRKGDTGCYSLGKSTGIYLMGTPIVKL